MKKKKNGTITRRERNSARFSDPGEKSMGFLCISPFSGDIVPLAWDEEIEGYRMPSNVVYVGSL